MEVRQHTRKCYHTETDIIERRVEKTELAQRHRLQDENEKRELTILFLKIFHPSACHCISL